MDRVNESLDFRESYGKTTQLMRESLITVEKNCRSLRDRIKEQRKSLDNSLRSIVDDPKKREALQATLHFYDHIRSELVGLEEVCHEYRVKIQADLALEITQRLQPPRHTSFASVKKAYELCDPTFLNLRNNIRDPISKKCFCHWTNISPDLLRHTQDIIYGPKRPMPSEFDESDQKFKQEMMILRTKMFSMSRNRNDEARQEEIITDDRRLSIGDSTKKEFIETVKKADPFTPPPLEKELSKIISLKFVDGAFKPSDVWMRLLDSYGQQLRSKWYVIVLPQIERILKNRRIPMIHLSAREIFDFISKIPENGFSFEVCRKDLIPMVRDSTEKKWLESWKNQLRTVDGKDVAAVLIQTYWRGFWVRKTMFESECKYIAASIIWVGWIVVKKKRQMHERYLRNMLTSLDVTRQLTAKFSIDYGTIINEDHVVIHLPSLGFPLDVRQTFGTWKFAIYQNTMSLKLSFIRNPRVHVIYVMPVKLTKDLRTMYEDLMETIEPNENFKKRATFLELSQLSTFADRSFNVARTLHASEDTLVEIRKIIDGKPTYCLPWIIDECDVRLAGNFGIPLLAPDLELQRRLLDRSIISDMIDELGLKQPPCVINIRDYETLCRSLAEQMCLHTEICVWLFILNVGLSHKHRGVFLINHMSVPLMPILRKERNAHGDEWKYNVEMRSNFFKVLSDHLPRVVSTLTRLTDFYSKWEDFYAHVVKYGCLLQAVPNERSSKYVSITTFIPGNRTNDRPVWTGTVEKIYLETESQFGTFVYTMPQIFVDNSSLEPVVEKLTNALRKNNYFGHLTIDLCCFRQKPDDEIISLVIEIHPCYDQAQHFVDWMKFAINGSYDLTSNAFHAEVALLGEESNRRFGIAVGQLYHSRLPSYSWEKLKALGKKCGVIWNSSTKEGSQLILHDGVSKEFAMLIAIASSIELTLRSMKSCLRNLYKRLNNPKGSPAPKSNFLEAIRRIDDSFGKHGNSSIAKCDPLNRVR